MRKGLLLASMLLISPFGSHKIPPALRKKITILAALALVASLGCARQVPKDWYAIGGSRADATVKLGFNYNPNTEKPDVSRQQADIIAETKCKTWGYTGAEPFGSVMQRCSNMSYSMYGPICYQMEVTTEYQCTGQIEPTPDPPKGKAVKN
jgi:hypothetical protein